MSKLILIPLVAVIFILIDLYVFQALKIGVQNFSQLGKNIAYGIYWGFTAITLLGFFLYHFGNPDFFSRVARQFMLVLVFMNYLSKTIALLVLLIGDVIRFGQWSFYKITDLLNNSKSGIEGEKISRSEFFAKSALVAGTLPLAAMSFGIISGAHDYRIRRKSIVIPNLPKAWHGVKIAQLSDIHSGSFWNRIAVEGGIDMLMAEKPDMVFFTGDLVNNEAKEVEKYIPIFSKLKADLGVYSTLGNHDYGDYKNWSSEKAKAQNLQDLKEAHKLMGWDLLTNENRILTVDKEPLAVLGVENWGAGRFAKYGDISKAYAGTEGLPTKILLSHDPSHWDAQIRKDYPDIDLMLAGHTHGFQFGIEIPGFKWSPSQYVYKQWAGLYQEGNQSLYVNRGYGYLGYPGRIGIPPEITILELRQG
ncbi:phosphoesterase [Marivirga tractuosa]|uniref:Metallophosphoesterase n=1 Tax=Marivirga tractuosa (strain ATCC 23168 / DSM 4126 / NBRC 15989 / NCIMB 1408 / VKM B-1430 / H-43) TaxID=643867 RepID=E4TPZ0_MARTH|nr:metallophosphoesterase [Marivirga tractuosa]ADR20547.1 metallophosphoesterase [Marivirga tractuosa DSM 4126]BDD15005.1 phosphoesterase [Marivirga tractuosa]